MVILRSKNIEEFKIWVTLMRGPIAVLNIFRLLLHGTPNPQRIRSESTTGGFVCQENLKTYLALALGTSVPAQIP